MRLTWIILLVVSSAVAADRPGLEPLTRPPEHPADNPGTSQKIALGEMLFFDTMLSRGGRRRAASHVSWTRSSAAASSRTSPRASARSHPRWESNSSIRTGVVVWVIELTEGNAARLRIGASFFQDGRRRPGGQAVPGAIRRRHE